MKLTSRWKSGIAAVIAVGSVFGVSAVSDVANALPPGTPPFQPGGGITLTPGSGTFATPFNYSYNPVNQACPGDNTQGWFFSPYLTADDPAQLTFSAVGSPISALGGRTTALRDTGGNLQRNIFPNLVDGALISFPDLSFAQTFASTPLVPGVYNVGIACFNANAVNGLGVRENARYWNTQVTFTGTGAIADSFAVGAAPAAPVLSAGAGTATTKTVNIDNPDSSVTSYSLNVVPAPADPLPTVAPGATSFNLTGLSLGQSYDVTLTANKTGFAGAASAPLTFTASTSSSAPIVTAPDAFEGNAVTITWTAPTTPASPAPASYDVAITPGGPTFTGVAGLSQVVPALPLGAYTATVTPNYAASSGVTGTAGSDGFNVNPNSLLYQEISVTRPPGALILTQRCGVYGPLDPFTAVDAFPGFPRTLGAAAAVASPGDGSDAPTIIGGALDGQPDPEIANYPEPSPASYPTECGLDMGTARFVTSGALAGQFYTAAGRLNQVTVLDTRDTDTGWIARGFVEDFDSGADTFAGSYLGWTPQVTDTSDPVGGSTYDQIVTAGPQVLPGTDPGLTVNSILGESLANEGLGIATLDARMNLLIPASADAGDYAATLSLSVIPRP